jgi:hypothetical protein
MSYRTHGGIDQAFSALPKVIKDAIELVRRLGFQYLWIDSLCIIQDSERSWTQNAFDMDLIYGNAIFTICAADGTNASTGLQAMHESTGTESDDKNMAYCTKDVQLVVSRPPEMYIKASKWNTRAWTFQERLLSRRCLIFTGSRVYFQCRSTGMSEDIYADREGAGWSLDFTDAPLQIFRQLPLRSMWVYMRLVELYTARQLTREQDILAAFTGVTTLMKRTMKADFVSGLPSSHFDLALLWEYPELVQRRQSLTTTEFPSWSWCGWTGAASQYRRDTLDGCLDDVKEWLKRRTWIRWHMRNSKGELCPLWDPDHWVVDVSDHDNWQGYGTFRSSGTMLFNRQQPGRRDSTQVHVESNHYTSSELTGVIALHGSHPPLASVVHPHLAPRHYRSASASSTSSSDSLSDFRTLQNTRSYRSRPGCDPASKEDGDDAFATYRIKEQTTGRNLETGDKLPETSSRLSYDKLKAKDDACVLSEVRSSTSAWLSWIYHNEFGRFFLDVLSALIRLALILLGVRLPSANTPILAPYTNKSLRGLRRSAKHADVLAPRYEKYEPSDEAGNTVDRETSHVREHVKHPLTGRFPALNIAQRKRKSNDTLLEPVIHPPINQEIITHHRNTEHGMLKPLSANCTLKDY